MTEKYDCTPAWFKDKTPFVQHGEKILETRLELLKVLLHRSPIFLCVTPHKVLELMRQIGP